MNSAPDFAALGPKLEMFRRIAMRGLKRREDAEDAVQDAFVLALTNAVQFRGDAALSTWFGTIVINTARMARRRSLRKRAVYEVPLDTRVEGMETVTVADTLLDGAPLASEIVEAESELERQQSLLYRALDRLSPLLREVVVARYGTGFKIEETAKYLGVPVGTVKARLARARYRLAEIVASFERYS